jgi:hypothetical protein
VQRFGSAKPCLCIREAASGEEIEMNFDDQDASLESLLAGVPLREPSLNLDARVNATFAKMRSQQPRRLRLHHMAIAAGILLAVGIGVRLSLPRKSLPVASTATPISHPAQIERDTSTLFDDGVVASTGEAAYQQFRRRTVREIWFVDPKNHSSLQVVIPTDQVLIQKVDAF